VYKVINSVNASLSNKLFLQCLKTVH